MKKIDDIGFCNLTSNDVVRHPLVQKIVQAYDEYEGRAGKRAAEGKDGPAKSAGEETGKTMTVTIEYEAGERLVSASL